MTASNGKPRAATIQVRDLPLPFPVPLITSAHGADARCSCTVVWSPEKGGESTPYCLKYRNILCVLHGGTSYKTARIKENQ